jgi:hypothetical protein
MRPLLVPTLASVLVIGLVLMILSGGVFVVAVREGATPDFDQHIALDADHSLVIRKGPRPTCVNAPNPPRNDCFAEHPEPREFSMYCLTPRGFRSLVWFRLASSAIQ